MTQTARLLLVAIIFIVLTYAGSSLAADQPTSPAESRATITVALSDNYSPFSFATADGQVRGIFRDLWDLWSQRTGIKVHYVLMDWTQALEWLAAGRLDVVGRVPGSDQVSRRFALSRESYPTEMFAYFRSSLVAIDGVESLKAYQIGTIAEGRCIDWLREQGVPNIRVYPTFNAMAEAAGSGEIDVFCSGRQAAIRVLDNKGVLGNQFRRSPPLFASHLHWAVRHDDAHLHQTIEDGFALISAAERQAIIDHWNGEAIDDPWNDHPILRWLALIVVGDALVALALVAWTVTLRRQVAARTAEVRAAGKQLAAMIDTLPGVVYRRVYLPQDSRMLFVSDQCRDLFGLSPDDIRAMSGRERQVALMHPEDWPTVSAMAEKIAAGAPQGESKARMRRPDDSLGWVLIREKVIERTENTIVVEGVIFDINAEAAAREALEASERRYRELIDDVNVIAWEWDITAQRFVYVSRQGPKLTGFSFDDWYVPGFWLDHIHPDDRDRAHDACASATARGEDHEFEYRMVRADGGVLWIHDIAHVHRKNGQPHSLRGLMLDITDQVNARKALERSEAGLREISERLATLIDRLPGVAFRVAYRPDGGRRALYLSGACAEYFGVPAAEVCSWSAERYTALMTSAAAPGDDITSVYRQLRDQGHTEIVQQIQPPNGPRRHLMIRGKLVGQVGEELISEGIVIDVTEEANAKAALEREEAGLRAIQVQLQEARRISALGDLAGGIAHEFNNMLGAILGYAGFIEEDALHGTSIHRHAGRILGVTRRGKALVDQILILTRQRGMHRSRFGFAELAVVTVADLERSLPAGAALRVLPNNDNADVEIEGDREQIGMALRGLCINGLDALAGKAGTVTVGTHIPDLEGEAYCRLRNRIGSGLPSVIEVWQDDSGANWAATGYPPSSGTWAALSVSDQGDGMDAPLLEQAFTPFFTAKERATNSGLGLSVVQGVVQAHGGAVIIKSRPGEGTTVEIVFPRAAA